MKRFVGHREVIEDGFLIDVHPLDAILNDNGDLIRERRIVSQQVRHRQRQHMAVTILML